MPILLSLMWATFVRIDNMLNTKDYQAEFRRFVSSQHLYTGIRVTAGVIIPSLLLYEFGLLSVMIGIPLGAVFVGLTDNPGPIHHRRNGLLITSTVIFFMALIAGLSRFNPWLIGAEILVFGIFFSLIAVYGTRASALGLTALIVFILGIDRELGSADILQVALYYFVGGLWYTLLSLSLSTLRPYRPIQQLMGECLMKTSAYLITKGLFYDKRADRYMVLARLMDHQVRIHQYQEQLRSMLFTTRRFVSETTHKGRILMMIFRDSVDLFEKIMTTQQDYAQLNEAFDDTGILKTFRKNISRLGLELYNTGLAVQEGEQYINEKELQDAFTESKESFAALREQSLNAGNVENFIKLRHILNSLRDLTGRIKRMQLYTTFDRELASEYKSDVDLQKFVSHQEFSIHLLRSNLSLESANFRHAARLTLALLIGYLISLFFPFGHGYWILLTIATIVKPAYGLTRQRNIQRLAGTFVGAAIGFLLLYTSLHSNILLAIMIATMILSYSTIKINYGVSCAGLTIFLLLSVHFMDPAGYQEVLQDRVVDTIIGSVIAYIVAYFVFPVWEYQQIDKLMTAALEAARKYFYTVAQSFAGKPADVTSFKVARKEAFVALANLSDIFQRMLSDPKNQQPNLPMYHQFVSACHILASYVASLSDYAQRYGQEYAHVDFQPLINIIDRSFNVQALSERKETTPSLSDIQSTPIIRRVHRLLDQRKEELEKGLHTSPSQTRKMMSELTTITDQFRLIHSVAEDAVKILREIDAKEL